MQTAEDTLNSLPLKWVLKLVPILGIANDFKIIAKSSASWDKWISQYWNPRQVEINELANIEILGKLRKMNEPKSYYLEIVGKLWKMNEPKSYYVHTYLEIVGK